MTTTHSRWFLLSMFGLLYFVQGSALAYFRNFQKPYLNSLNVDLNTIGLLTSILLLPFILKIFIGMLSDRVNLLGFGHRKPYIILGLLLAATAFGTVGFVLPDTNLIPFAILIVTGSFSVALFDSTTDGLAIDITPETVRLFHLLALIYATNPLGFTAVLWLLGGVSLLTLPILWGLFKKTTEAW